MKIILSKTYLFIIVFSVSLAGCNGSQLSCSGGDLRKAEALFKQQMVAQNKIALGQASYYNSYMQATMEVTKLPMPCQKLIAEATFSVSPRGKQIGCIGGNCIEF